MIHLVTLRNIEEAINLCDNFLGASNARNTEIETFLTQHLLILICRTYEAEIRRIVVERAKRSGDQHLSSYVEKTFRGYRSLALGDMRGNILKKFGETHLANFDNKVLDTEAGIRFNNIVENRNKAAHEGTINITFEELKNSYKKAEEVLDAFSEAINM